MKIIKNLEGLMQNEDVILTDNGSRNDKIDILLGNDYYFACISNLKIELKKRISF